MTTKVSTRHLNEIIRERNQYSRDAQDAWQDFITSKGRMDTEISKVTKRNNFLVEELENWKQQVSLRGRVEPTAKMGVRQKANDADPRSVPQIPSLRRAAHQRDARPQDQD